MIDLGRQQIDAALYQRLLAEHVADGDARELARMDRFGGADPDLWLRGLHYLAQLASGTLVALDWGQLPRPWDTLGPKVVLNGQSPDMAVVEALTTLDSEVALILYNALQALVQVRAQQATTPVQQTHLGNPVSPVAAARAVTVADLLKPPDENLVRMVIRTLDGKGAARTKKKRAGEFIQSWLLEHGRFVRTVYGQAFYLYSAEHRLYALDNTDFDAWLYLLTGISPAASEFKFLKADVWQLAKYAAETVGIVRLASWDTAQQVLRVSRFDGVVYRLDGCTIETEANGDGPVVFQDAIFHAPYDPDLTASAEILDWPFKEIPNWDGPRDELSEMFKNWWLATFFTELCPTRPILLMKGEKGSGKSMLIRILLRLIFGPWVDVAGIPEKPDDFITMASNAHIIALDNADEGGKELRDRLARLSTGGLDKKRQLYTTNDEYTIVYRTWCCVTARTPDALQRDDLADRLLILPVKRLEDTARRREFNFLTEVMARRNQWWGALLLALNSVVAEIRRHGIPARGGLRMEDWAALGTVLSRSLGDECTWENGLSGVRQRQTDLLLENDVIHQGCSVWLADPNHPTTALETRQLYSALKAALYEGNRPDDSWPRSVKSFGKHLAGIRRELAAELRASMGVEMRWKEARGRTYYEFKPISESKPVQGRMTV